MIISDDYYFILGLRHLLPESIFNDNSYILFDAGGGVVYLMWTSIINEIQHFDMLTALLENRFIHLNKNSTISEYIMEFNHDNFYSKRLSTLEKLTHCERVILRLLGSKFLAPHLSVVDIPKRKLKGLSLHKRNGLRKLGLKNDMVYFSVVASWDTHFSQLAEHGINTGNIK